MSQTLVWSFQWVHHEPRAKPKLEFPRPQELFIPQQRDFLRVKAEIWERVEKRKRKYAERQERGCRYAENGTLEEQERERVYQEKLKRNRVLNDAMERWRWRLKWDITWLALSEFKNILLSSLSLNVSFNIIR